ncbi:MAG: M48 family metallopeptidase [Candidatus Ancillula sp.]|nr:M48 family metallopeptidase [Candidatus Ancillula sp.]
MMICGHEVHIQFKVVKNLRMKILAETGQLLLTVPVGTSHAVIEKFISSHTSWIDRQLEKIALRPTIDRINNEELLTSCEQLMQYWQEKLGVEVNRTRLRKMKTRWGVCNINTHIITINSELTKYPEQCLEYVIVHELTHLRVAAHNKEFWAIVENFLPDYKLWRSMLK